MLTSFKIFSGIELLSIDFSGINPMGGFKTTRRAPGKTDRVQCLYGSTLLTKDEQNRLYLWDATRPSAQLELRSSGIQVGHLHLEQVARSDSTHSGS